MICMNIFMYPSCAASFGSLSVDVEGSASLSVLPPLHIVFLLTITRPLTRPSTCPQTLCLCLTFSDPPHTPSVFFIPWIIFSSFHTTSSQLFLSPALIFTSSPVSRSPCVESLVTPSVSVTPSLPLPKHVLSLLSFLHTLFLLPSFAGWTVPQLSGLGFYPL